MLRAGGRRRVIVCHSLSPGPRPCISLVPSGRLLFRALRRPLSLFLSHSTVSARTHSVYQRGNTRAWQPRSRGTYESSKDSTKTRMKAGNRIAFAITWRSCRRRKREKEKERTAPHARDTGAKMPPYDFSSGPDVIDPRVGERTRTEERRTRATGAPRAWYQEARSLSAISRRGPFSRRRADFATRSSDDTRPGPKNGSISRTVDLTVRWSAPPPPHSHSWSRGESRRPICFVTANARLLLLLLVVLLRIGPSRCLLRRRRPQCSSAVFRTALLEEKVRAPIRVFNGRPSLAINRDRSCDSSFGNRDGRNSPTPILFGVLSRGTKGRLRILF